MLIQQEVKDTVAYYLVHKDDTAQTAYKVAYELEHLMEDTEAVILRKKHFHTFPNELLKCKKLQILILEDVNFSEISS